jgi:long-chain acyl-CoA synthetase
MNLARLAEENVMRFGVYDAVHFQGRWHTNAEELQEARRFASVLRALGVAPDDRVAVMLPNCLEVFAAYGGALAVGGVVVPIVFLLAAGEVEHLLADARPKVLVTAPVLLDKVVEATASLAEPPTVVVVGEPVPDGMRSWSDLLSDAEPNDIVIDRGPGDLAVIMYTGGTTGRPKGVELSHENLRWNAVTCAEAVGIRPGSVSLLCLPVAHLFGMIAGITGQVLGTRGILLDWFTPEGVLGAIEEHRVEHMPLVPTMMTLLLQHPEETDVASLRTVFASAAPVPTELAEGFEKRFDCEVLEAYGQTEAAPALALQRPGLPKKAGSAGPPLPGVQLRIEDEAHAELPAGEVGEICGRSSGVMLGYHGLADATGEALAHGWLHTGDVGYLDEDGYLFVTDRKKDLIIRGGFNVYPRDVEDTLLQHPGVAEAAVVGRPDARMGEEVVAFVVKEPGHDPTEEELLAFAATGLAAYRRPREIRFTRFLPRSPIGKVLKKELREGL